MASRRGTFPLAEMSPLVLVLTVIVLALPVALAIVGLLITPARKSS